MTAINTTMSQTFSGRLSRREQMHFILEGDWFLIRRSDSTVTQVVDIQRVAASLVIFTAATSGGG